VEYERDRHHQQGDSRFGYDGQHDEYDGSGGMSMQNLPPRKPLRGRWDQDGEEPFQVSSSEDEDSDSDRDVERAWTRRNRGGRQ
jgi:hypothetical protein